MAYTELFADAAAGSNLNGGAPLGGAYPVTATNGAYTQGGGAGGTDRFTAAAGTPFSGCAAGDFVSSYADGAAAPTGFVGRVTAVNGGGASLDISLTAIAGTRPTTAASGRTAKVGGAWAGPVGASAFPFGFVTAALTDAGGDIPRVNFKGGTSYAVTAAMTHSLAGPVVFQGYTASAGDGGRATIDGGTSGAAYQLLLASGADLWFRDLIFQNNGATGGAATTPLLNLNGARTTAERCTFTGSRGPGARSDGLSAVFLECEAYGNNLSNTANVGGFQTTTSSATYVRCLSHDNAGSNSAGFRVTAGSALDTCVADTNGGPGFSASVLLVLRRCTSYGNGGAGFAASNGAVVEGCLFEGNTTYGIDNSSAGLIRAINCAFFNNTSGLTNGIVDATGTITLTASAMADPGNGDFGIVNIAARSAGRGAFVQNAGSYAKTTTSYPDVGAVQHRDTGARVY